MCRSQQLSFVFIKTCAHTHTHTHTLRKLTPTFVPTKDTESDPDVNWDTFKSESLTHE